jgi:beta-aspartyl-peptidase (threonine type)
MTPTLRAAYEADLRDALVRGYTVLANGGASLNACIAAVLALEDSPLFNAGKGAVFTADGRNDLDAAVMEGAGLRAVAVAGVTTIRNPVLAARAVMEASPHVLLIGPAAEDFAARQGLTIVEPDYFFTQERYDQLERAKAEGAIQLDHDGTPNAVIDLGNRVGDGRYGTVGAVAVDRNGTGLPPPRRVA